MKRALCLLLFCLLLLSPARACAQEESVSLAQGVQELLSGLDLSAWDALLGEGEAKALVARFAEASQGSTPQDLLGRLWQRFAQGFSHVLPQVGLCLALSLIGGVLEHLQEHKADDGGDAARATQLLCAFLAALPLLSCFALLLRQSAQTVTRITSFCNAALPLLLGLLSATGAVHAAGAIQPLSLAFADLSSRVLGTGVLSGAGACAALCVAGSVSDGIGARLQKLRRFAVSACKWVMGAVLGAFTAVLLVQGTVGATRDGVTLRTAKYALDHWVPIVGGLFADSFDTLVGCCLILQNAVGMAGMVYTALLCLEPILSLACAIGAYRLGSALLEPAGCTRTAALLDGLAEVLTLLLAVVVSCAVLLLLLLAAAVLMSDRVAMLR